MLQKIYNQIEATHQGCGKLAVMELLADASNRTLLVIASSGTGKSTILKWLKSTLNRDYLWLDSVTVSGFKFLSKKLSGKNMSILVDDLSKGGTQYSQVMTVTALGELVYSGYVRKLTAQLNIDISGFRGSAIINCQPLLLKRILSADEFETDIRDKVIRYYHIRRPIKVNLNTPTDGVEYDYDYYKVDIPEEVLKSQEYEDGVEQFRLIFSKARAKEHYQALIQASANINKRSKVSEADIQLVNYLTKCFFLEGVITFKTDLEGKRDMDVNIIPLLSSLASYKQYSLADLMKDFQVKRSRIYDIIQDHKELVATIETNNGTHIIPTMLGRSILKECGEWEDDN